MVYGWIYRVSLYTPLIRNCFAPMIAQGFVYGCMAAGAPSAARRGMNYLHARTERSEAYRRAGCIAVCNVYGWIYRVSLYAPLMLKIVSRLRLLKVLCMVVWSHFCGAQEIDCRHF